MTDLALAGVAYAEANWGCWVARCPRPWCTNAVQLTGGQPEFACVGRGGCGYGAEVVWPADPQAIEAILAMRPVERTRNWLPGEALADLIAENLAHDIGLPEIEGDAAVVATIVNEHLVGGLLHQHLVAAARPQIGA